MAKKSKKKEKKKKKEKSHQLLIDERTTVKNANLYVTGWKPSFVKDRYNRSRARPAAKVHEPPIPISVGVLPTGAATPHVWGKEVYGGGEGTDAKGLKGEGEGDDGEEDLNDDEKLQARKKAYDKYINFDEVETYRKARDNDETQRWDWKKCFFEVCCGCCKKPKNADWPDDDIIPLTTTPETPLTEDPTTPEPSPDPTLSDLTSSDDSLSGLYGDDMDFPDEGGNTALQSYLERLGQGDLEGIRDPKCSQKQTCIIDAQQEAAFAQLALMEAGKDSCTCPSGLACLGTWNKELVKKLGICDMALCSKKELRRRAQLAAARGSAPWAAGAGAGAGTAAWGGAGGARTSLQAAADDAAFRLARGADAAGPGGSRATRSTLRMSRASIIAEVPRVTQSTRRECKRAEIPGGQCPCSSSSVSSTASELSDESDFEAWSQRQSMYFPKKSSATPTISRAEAAINARRALRATPGRWRSCCRGASKRSWALTEALAKEILQYKQLDPKRPACTCSVRKRDGPCLCKPNPPPLREILAAHRAPPRG